ncbi:MAG: zinc-dependent peptidase [Chitinophagaceae bacterium]
MPVLISSTAIQLSFGLQKYLLPHFTCINIHPEEFLGIHPTIRFLQGNVSGNCINISWKYFLQGFQFPQDGKNVGLHEMAHAYYYQNFGPCEIKDTDFIKTFNKFNDCGNKVYTSIQDTDPCLYSNYAKRNFQEFWAESIELFFEKPMEVRTSYPVLYESISDLLNQDPTKRFT